MATRTTESTNTLETFRVNFNGVVDDIGNVTVSSAGDQLSTVATTVVGAINEIFAGFNLASQISGEADFFPKFLNFNKSFLLNDTLLGITSVQLNLITPLGNGTPAATDPVVFGTALDGTGTNYNVKFASPGDTVSDYGSTQGFAAAMAVALG